MQTNRSATRGFKEEIEIPSVETRLRRANQSIVLALAAASRLADPESVESSREDLTAIIASLLKDASGEVYWLTQLPGGVLARIAPDGDQAEAIDRGSVPVGGAE